MISALDILVIASSAFWLICELAVLRNKRAGVTNAGKKKTAAMYFIQIVTAAAGAALGYYFKFTQYFLYNLSFAFPIAGAALIGIGLALRLSAIYQLKDFLAVNIVIWEGQILKTTGLYKLIRHPAYTGQLLSFAGLGILFGNPVSFLIIFIPDLILILLRIRREEAMLAAKFGEEYIAYKKRTKKLIPYIF